MSRKSDLTIPLVISALFWFSVAQVAVLGLQFSLDLTAITAGYVTIAIVVFRVYGVTGWTVTGLWFGSIAAMAVYLRISFPEDIGYVIMPSVVFGSVCYGLWMLLSVGLRHVATQARSTNSH